jgi:hypothetical protein
LPPFFLKRGAVAPFLRSSAPLLRKKGGNDTKKGGNDTDRKYRYRANLIPGNTDTKKMTRITAVYNTNYFGFGVDVWALL